MSPQLEELWLEHAIASLEKQWSLADVVGERAWECTMSTGVLTFKGRGFLQKSLSYQMQVLGTEAHDANTWLWAWANESVPENVRAAARRLNQLGEERGIPELVTDEFNLEQADGHTLAMIASGVLDARGYYRGPYGGGAAFLLIPDEKLPRPPAPDTLRVIRMITQSIGAVALSDHRRAVAAYLRYIGWKIEERGDELIGGEGANQVRARFDGLTRLAEINSVVARGSS